MTIDEIRHQLSTARGIPQAALAAAVEQAEALLPETLRLMELASSHVMMTRPDERLLFYGVHALAAARRAELYEPLLRLIENRSHEIEWLLSGAPLNTLLISSYAPGCRLPYDLLENLTIHDEVRSDLFLLMAWLVWQGHAPCDVFTAFLDRFDRDGSVDPDDFAWFGWQSAISLLGLNEFEERMRAGWEAGRMRHDRDVDREAWLAQLHQAERDGPISEEFAHYSAEPIRDIFAALRRIPFFGFGRITYSDEIDPSDPARDIRLMSDEWGWLELFLASETVPLDAMTVERLDGYQTALAIGPEAVPRAEWWPLIWSESGKEPEFPSESLERYVNELIDRHFETIRRRLLTRYRHVPLVEADSPQEDVEEWAIGFSIGLDLSPGKWDRIAEHEHASLAFAAIAMLLPPEDLAGKVNLPEQTEDARNGMLDKLPDMIRQIYAFWRGQPVQPLFGPRRVQKVGRNEHCPCGSGRKYKKCCGAN